MPRMRSKPAKTFRTSDRAATVIGRQYSCSNEIMKVSSEDRKAQIEKPEFPTGFLWKNMENAHLEHRILYRV
jgi:hypothetical protein